MKKYLIILFICGLGFKAGANIIYDLKYNPGTDRFEVYFKSTVAYPGVANVGGSVATIAFDPGYNTAGLNAGSVISVAGGAWLPQDKATGTGGAGTLAGKNVVAFETAGAPIANVPANTDVLLFTFTFGAGLNCTGTLRMYVNGTDPIDPGSPAAPNVDFTSTMFIVPTQYDATNTDLTFNNCAALTVVPVRFLSFDAVKSGDDALLSWVVGNEDVNTDHYLVERSLNRVEFTTIATVNARHNGIVQNSYDLRDPGISKLKSSVIYYRIRQFDADGKFIYSEIRTLRVKDNANGLFLYPNPATSYINLEMDMMKADQASIRITDNAGKEMMRTEYNVNSGLNIHRIDVSKFASGTYLITISTAAETKTLSFVKGL